MSLCLYFEETQGVRTPNYGFVGKYSDYYTIVGND